jgi:uncharacterized membrane protein YciS (DUF1049 family)
MRSFARVILIILGAIAGAIAIALMYVNRDPIRIMIPSFPWEKEEVSIIYESPLWVVMFISFLAGLVFPMVIILRLLLQHSISNLKQKQRIAKLEEEVLRLKNMPIDSPVPFEDLPHQKEKK